MKLMRISLFLPVIGGMLICTQAHAQDVYNFYFQKGKAPSKVIQGGQQETQSEPNFEITPEAPVDPPVNPEAPVQELSTNTVVEASEKKYEGWMLEVGFGSGDFMIEEGYSDFFGFESGNARRADGLNLGLRYSFNRYVGVGGNLLFYTGGIDLAPDLSLFLALTPVRFDIFGYEAISIGFTAGYMTAQIQGSGDFYNSYDESDIMGRVGTEVMPFLGFEMGVNFSDRSGLLAAVKAAMPSDSQVERYSYLEGAEQATLSYFHRF